MIFRICSTGFQTTSALYKRANYLFLFQGLKGDRGEDGIPGKEVRLFRWSMKYGLLPGARIQIVNVIFSLK